MKDAIIFDVDGTLADCSHRVHHVKNGNKDWDKFFKGMSDDTPVPGVVWLAEVLGDYHYQMGGAEIFVVSARPDTYRSQTENWLSRHCPDLWTSITALLMRNEGDHRPDTEVKKDILKGIQSQGYNVRLVIDDRPSVIKMWREQGIPVLQVPNDEWDVPKYGPGELTLLVGPSGAGKSVISNSFPSGTLMTTLCI